MFIVQYFLNMYHVHSAALDKTMNKTVLPSSRAYPKGALSML